MGNESERWYINPRQLEELVVWYGILLTEAIDADLVFDETLWDTDPDLYLKVVDAMDVEGLLSFGGYLDASV